MTPTKIELQKTATHIMLRVTAPDTAKGYSVIESVPINRANPGKSIPGFRKHGQQYAKRFGIPFVDRTI